MSIARARHWADTARVPSQHPVAPAAVPTGEVALAVGRGVADAEVLREVRPRAALELNHPCVPDCDSLEYP